MKRLILTIMVAIAALTAIGVAIGAFSGDDESESAIKVPEVVKDGATDTLKELETGAGEALPAVAETASKAWNLINGDDQSSRSSGGKGLATPEMPNKPTDPATTRIDPAQTNAPTETTPGQTEDGQPCAG